MPVINTNGGIKIIVNQDGNVFVYEGDTDSASKEFKDNSFDLIFIDADHSYEAVKKDLDNWIPKLKPGGKISGHDYGNKEGVGRAVNERFDNVKVNQLHFQIHSGVAISSVWSKRL